MSVKEKSSLKMVRYVLWFVFFTGCLAQEDLGGKVFLFPKATDTAHVILKPVIKKPVESFTVCLESYTELTREHSLFSLAVPGKDNALLIFPMPPTTCRFILNQEPVDPKVQPEVFDWKHTCVAWESGSGVVQLWINGKLYPRTVLKKGPLIDAKASIILGQEQDSYGGGFDISQSFMGEISNVHMWDYVLTQVDIQKVLAGKKDVNGNIINWRSLQYEIKGDVTVQPKLQCRSLQNHYNLLSSCNET
ncbi:hypothetical protein XENTR_v10022297 [Xenopus tropicalis]|uniref:Pentraxin family member n=1 Tax=Xenopus tropicalis TaxID=8364 RepID=A0A803K1S4_XENTR|nr:amyloid P component, serum protein isoform X1 [Xenopus tropicalis]KAE8588038.1 hypothetical protein XENTR_v10022297 [Xenopus tropicalis]